MADKQQRSASLRRPPLLPPSFTGIHDLRRCSFEGKPRHDDPKMFPSRSLALAPPCFTLLP